MRPSLLYKHLRTAGAALILMASAQAWAAPDPEALAERLTDHALQCGRFEQTRWLADLETQLDSRGTFQRHQQALIWQTTVPIEDRVVLSPDNEALPLSFQIMLPVFNGLLSGDWQALERHFTVKLGGTLNDWQADLTPKEAAVGERLSHLMVSGDRHVERVELAFASGDRMTLNLTAASCQALEGDAGQADDAS